MAPVFALHGFIVAFFFTHALITLVVFLVLLLQPSARFLVFALLPGLVFPLLFLFLALSFFLLLSHVGTVGDFLREGRA